MPNPSLVNIITHNSTKPITKCYSIRPCHRPNCLNCLHRKKKYIAEQVYPKIDELELEQHLTITVLGFLGSLNDGLNLLLQIRPALIRKLKKIAPVFSCTSVSINEYKNGDPVPHFHMLCSDKINKPKIKEIFLKTWGFEVNVSQRKFGQTKEDLKNIFGYWLEQNVKPSMPYKARFKRLITGPSGILLGRPKYHYAPLEFRLLEEMNEII